MYYEMFRSYTDEEIREMRSNCASSGGSLQLSASGTSAWCVDKKDPVENCIKMWVDSVDEKYNNPDTVSDLRESEYQDVVKQCEETFKK